jgi:hypothetical protein
MRVAKNDVEEKHALGSMGRTPHTDETASCRALAGTRSPGRLEAAPGFVVPLGLPTRHTHGTHGHCVSYIYYCIWILTL